MKKLIAFICLFVGSLCAGQVPPFQIVSPTNGQFLVYNSTTGTWQNQNGGGGGGGVSTFSAGNLSPLFTTSVSNPTSTPALSFTLTNQNANLIYAGPATGSAAAPTFRALVAADIPSLSYAPQTSGAAILYGNGSGGFSSVTIGSNLTFSGGTLSATGGGGGGVTSVGVTAPSAFTVTGSPITTSGTIAISNAATSAISSAEINWSLSSQYSKTLAANTTFTFSNQADGEQIVVAITNTSSNYTVTWPSVSWPGGIIPTQTVGAHTDIYTFIDISGTIYGSAIQNF